MMQPRAGVPLTLNPGVPRDLQRHLVNAAAICVAAGSDIERCFSLPMAIVLSD